MMSVAFGCIPDNRQPQCLRWYAQTEDDNIVTAQVLEERLRPGDRVWAEVPPSLHVPQIAPGDSFVQFVCDSGEGPAAHCDVAAVFLSGRRWVVYWTSGDECWGCVEYREIDKGYIRRGPAKREA